MLSLILPNQPNTFYERNKSFIWSVIIFTAFQSTLIAFLLLNIIRRRRIESVLQESEELHRVVLGSISDAVFITDDTGRLTYISPFMDVIFGYTHEEISRMNNVHRFLNGFRVDEQQLRTHKELHNIDWEITDKNGQSHALLVTIKSVSIKNGTRLYTCRDITPRKKAEMELKRNEERLRLTLESTQDGLWENNLKTQQNYYSMHMFSMLGYTPPSMDQGHDFFLSILHPDDRNTCLAEQEKLNQPGHDDCSMEYRMRDSEGNWHHILSRGRCIERDENSNPVRILGTHTDITKIKQLEEQLRQSQKMEAIGKLAGGIAHDFNNLIMAIEGYSAFILRGIQHDEHLRTDAQEIIKAAERAASLTRQLLAYSRKQILDPKPIHLNLLLENMDNMLHRIIGEDIHLITRLDPDLGTVKADPGQIEQVIMNLVVNARDAMPDGGTLTLQTENTTLHSKMLPKLSDGDYVVLTVSDTGIGMDQPILEQIFDPFFTTKEQGKGTGLGLSTVYGIIEQSEGAISVSSEPGKGAIFCIYLPRIPEESYSEMLDARFVISGTGKATVFVVEDEEMVRSLITRTLEIHQYTVLIAEHPQEAIQIAEKHQGMIHLLLTDVVMPQMNGPQLAEYLTALHPEMKVLYMSGYTNDAVFQRGIQEEGLHFMQKPFTPDGLIREIQEILS